MTDTGGERVEGPRLPDRSVDDVTRFHLEKSLTPTQIQIQMQLEMDSASRRHVHSPLLSADLPEFEPPNLLKVRGLGYAWIALRVITTVWAIALGIAAVLVRNDAEAGFSDGAIVAKVGFAGALIAYALTVVGGFWSVRLTMNVHRLEGRYPTRNRAVRAWLYPGLWAGLMALTLVRAEPNADFDIRPLIIVTGFMITMWRPYALVRRIFLSLTRTSVDALIGVMYVLDVAGFGLIWWRVANWPEVLTPTNAGTADVMIGVGFATAVAFAAAGLVVILLVRAAETGQAHRMVVLRTRHDHRIARTLGLDPLDEAVRWALVEVRRQQEARAVAAAAAQAGYDDRSVEAIEQLGSGSVAVVVGGGRVDTIDTDTHEVDTADVERTDVETADARADTAQVDTLVDEAAVVETAVEEPVADQPVAPDTRKVPANAAVVEVVDVVDEAIDSAPEIVDPEIVEPEPDTEATEPEAELDPFADVVGVENRLAARMAAAEAAVAEAAKASGDRASRLAARLSHPDTDATPHPHAPPIDDVPATPAVEPEETLPVETPTVESTPDPAVAKHEDDKPREGTLAERLSARLNDPSVVMSSAERKLALDLTPAAPDNRVDQLSSRLTEFDPVRDAVPVDPEAADSLKALVDRYKQENPDAVPPDRDTSRFSPDGFDLAFDEGERLTPPRVYPLEAARYIMLLAFGLATLGFGWIVLRSVDTEASLELGKLSLVDVDRIDSARRAALTALSASLPLVALWAFVLSVYSRRAGVANVRPRLCAGLFVVSAAITLTSQIIDGAERGTLSLISFFLSVTVAAVALYLIMPIAAWFERSTVTAVLWATAMPLLVVLTWISGMQRPIVSEDSLEKLAFFGVIEGLGAGLITVLAAITMVDLEDGLRSSIELAEPIRPHVSGAGSHDDQEATATPAGVS